MHIMIDGMNLALSQGTGVATYARNLSYCVKARGHHLSVLYGRPIPAYRDPVLREAAFFDVIEKPKSELAYYADLARSVRRFTPVEIAETGAVERAELSARLPRADRFLNIRDLFFVAAAKFQHFGGLLEVEPDEPVDIAHWTYPVPARVRGARNIYTFHDLVPLKLPYTTLDFKARYLAMLKALCRTADRIVTVSEHSRRDIVDMLGVAPDMVVNTYQSVSIPQDMLDETERQVEISLDAMTPGGGRTRAEVRRGEYFLYVGAIEPKKNLARIIEAYLSSGSSHPLVVVGRQAWSCEREMKLIAQGGARILYLDYVPFSQVVTLMRGARALVFASLYEGFGLPVLEAFLCGAPVITADASSTKEIAGDAALLVDPYDVRAIRDAFRRLSGEAAAPLLAELSDRGRRRAADFGEDRIAGRLDELYRDLAA